MSDVFISYSRQDKAFVAQLREALVAQNQDIWIDWEDIPPSQAWWEEIKKGIARANNVVVILSANSLGSPVCHLEIEYARSLKKRIIPVYHADYTREACLSAIQQRLSKKEDTTTKTIWGTRQPEAVFDDNASELSPLNYFFFKAEDDFQTRFDELFKIIRTDFEHKERHTTYELRATEWKRRREDPSFLLLDNELQEARVWLSHVAGKEPSPTDLQRAYIAASEKRTRQLATIRRASIVGSGVAAVAIVFAVIASLMGIQAADRAREANNQQATSVVILGTAEHRANDANTQVAFAAMTATQSAIVQDISSRFAEIIIASSDKPMSRAVAMSEVVADYPDQADAYVLRGIAYEMDGEPEQARADYSYAIELDPQNPSAYANRANTYDSSDPVEYQLLMDDLNKAIALNPETSIFYYNRGAIYYETNQLELAIDDFNAAIDLNPNDPDSYHNRGVAYSEMGDAETAIADFSAAIDLDDADPQFFRSRGQAYSEMGDTETAIADFSAAIDLDPRDAETYYTRGVVYMEQGELDQALDDLNISVELDPSNEYAFINRAYVFFELDRIDEALADATQAIELAPENPDTYDTRCELYLKTEQWSLGLADCDMALTLEPSWEFRAELGDLIETAREQAKES